MTDTGFRSLTAEEIRRAAAGVVPLPIEQTAVWEAFEASQGRTLWGRYAWEEDGRTCALVCLHETSLRGFTYLWARHGPVWLKEQSPPAGPALPHGPGPAGAPEGPPRGVRAPALHVLRLRPA